MQTQAMLFEAPIPPATPRTIPALERKSVGQHRAVMRSGAQWIGSMLEALRKFLNQRGAESIGGKAEFTFEDFRIHVEATTLPKPASINAWGALPQQACRSGLCRWTGKVQPGKRDESHGRLLKVWVAL